LDKNRLAFWFCPDKIRQMRESPSDNTYSVGAVSKLTGLSPDVLRAWERRYNVVEPLRTEGGTRRYRASDLERLRLVKSVVDAGYRIGDVAQLSAAELEARTTPLRDPHQPPLDAVLDALSRLDGPEAERLIGAQLAALGPTAFAQDFALPLLQTLGDAWQTQQVCIASEHLGSSLLRSQLGSAMRPSSAINGAPVVVFATPPGERHEIGLLIAALTALSAGASPLYLGIDLPVSELVNSVTMSGARALAISIVILPASEAAQVLREIRAALPDEVDLWVGGRGSDELALPDGVERIDSMQHLQRRVEMLRIRVGAP
jgi:DNA-binding transcriptional MerR regulator